ncbi:uncharacterized protein EI90DRAFT_3050780 [Cantharellus anzutake]|uniref:uncharacterized protein n=1 Tax=Cantharellus anzutake TaxID=1750568 RepID=UPI001906BA22|nr:uncharacterized protein EI90DRAFT_3050780 [Cantharellus anzutake]KAF8334039.1 hypothetical protein EI90DRAFT_3050780 [Cantharellus anzutake]
MSSPTQLPIPATNEGTSPALTGGSNIAGELLRNDEFQLYDLKVEVVVDQGSGEPSHSDTSAPPRLLCGAHVGDYFTLEGEMLYLPPGQGISIYSLASVLPLLAAKQRPTSHADWMTTDALVKCPDPNCPSLLKITRTGIRTFRHGETTLVL